MEADAVENAMSPIVCGESLIWTARNVEINVLRSVGKAHEGGHQDDEEKKCGQEMEQVPWPCRAGMNGRTRFFLVGSGKPDGRFLHARLNIECQQRGSRAEDE